jgi:hypothetical protein
MHLFNISLQDIAKKARRLGTPEPTMTIVREFSATTTDDEGITRTTHMTEFALEAEAPKLSGGWKFVAAIAHHEVGNIVSVAPDFQNEQFNLSTVDSVCSHCNTNRTRKMTLLLQDESGERVRVGSNCAKDYLGHNIPSVWAIWDALDALTDEFSGDKGSKMAKSMMDIGLVVAIASHLTMTRGFKPSSFEGEATKVQVNDILNSRDAQRIKFTAEELEVAKQSQEWVMTNGQDNDYMNNLRVALQVGDWKHLGLIASLPAAFIKFRDGEVAKAKVEAIPTAPVVEGRIVIQGQVVKAYTMENDYGVREVMVVRDDRGFSVWGTVPSAISVEIGDTVVFTATVEVSDKDETFGFFKRPSKAQLIAA